MPTKKPFRFSWQAYVANSAADWRNKAQTAEAMATLKVGCRVFCTSYWPAAVLVKDAMTID